MEGDELMSCTARCETSKAKRCRCSCAGKSHGSAYRAQATLQELDAQFEKARSARASFERWFSVIDPISGSAPTSP